MTIDEPTLAEPTPDAAPAPEKRRVDWRPIAAAAVVTAVVAAGIGYKIGVDHERNRIASAAVKAFAGLESDLGSSSPRPSATSSVAPPTEAEIHLPVKVLSKECFGSAGCNVSVRVMFEVPDVSKLQGADFEVTYSLEGGTDGAVVGTFEVRNGRYNAPTSVVQTESSSDEITATVTDVEAA